VFGLYDMPGNVNEWVWDVWNVYPSVAVTDPKGPSPNFGNEHWIRGGTFFQGDPNMRSAARYYSQGPENRNQDIGIRIVRSLQ
jgi:formylglycine-generating enzyme required for sulfatase activity